MKTPKQKHRDYKRIIGQYVTLFLLLTYMVLPSVSSTIANAFSCTNVDPDNVDGGDDSYLTYVHLMFYDLFYFLR